MACVRRFGKPHLFITFTTNPNWEEITASLGPRETHADRPDICVRVFYQKFLELKHEIQMKNIFGKVVCFLATIEFQKRGLPHAHILLTLSSEDGPNTPERVDRVVCAEIPDPIINPILYGIVNKHNIHGPCGAVNKNSPCMVGEGNERHCSKSYPKKLKETTTLDMHNYPEYRRRIGAVFEHRSGFLDNTWVVPYNPILTLRYNCHINVEVVHSTKCVKYLYKVIPY